MKVTPEAVLKFLFDLLAVAVILPDVGYCQYVSFASERF